MKKLILLLLAAVGMRSVEAQYAAPLMDSMYSAILGEQRKIEIILPLNYATDSGRYDVWYVPDGEWNTHTFSVIADYLFAIGFAPRVIVVGIHNRYDAGGFNYRDRDFTPVKGPEMDSSGGAGKFLAFFEKELIPVIKKRYRTSQENGIFGSSLGGVFVLYALLERPELFRYYAVADPAFHFAGQYMCKLAAERMGQLTEKDRALHLGGRDGISYEMMGRKVMDSVLEKYAPENLHWQAAVYKDETHISSVFKSNYDGLKFAYLGYSAMKNKVNLTGGIVAKEKPVKLYMQAEHADIRYTTDGSQPTRKSARWEESVVLSDPSQLRITSFSSGGNYDRDIRTNLKTGNFFVPRKLSGKMKNTITAPVDGYYVFQFPQGFNLVLNDSVVAGSLAVSSATHEREMIIVPLRKGSYAVSWQQPVDRLCEVPVECIVFYSEDGQDNWQILTSYDLPHQRH